MEYQWIQDFLTSPQLPDILAYLLIGAGYIGQYFVKRFVKKDNFLINTQVSTKVAKLEKMHVKIEESDKKHEKDRENWGKEKEALLEENKNLKKAIRLCCFNNKELVKNGIANEVVKLLPLEEEKQGEESND